MFWLDAGRQSAACEAHKKRPPLNGDSFDVWYDGSGNKLDFTGREPAALPRLASAGGRTAIRFDGYRTHLDCDGPSRSFDQFTVLLVAAPRTNGGKFRALLAGCEPGKNDYSTGFNIDLGPDESAQRFSDLNVEGRGMSGATNLMRSPGFPFREFQCLTIAGGAGPGAVKLFVNGKPTGQRDREPGPVRFDRLMLGARCYSNDPRDAPYPRGMFDGDIAEVLVYDRLLSDAERRAVEAYLSAKHAGLSAAISAIDLGGGRRLRSVEHPPAVQFLLPGFTVRQLPLDLTNINNIRYRPDGRLVALAYNGNVYLLSDADGDGLEDHPDLFFENNGRLQAPIGMALTPPGYKKGQGLFVASKGKLSLLVDSEGHDRAHEEIVYGGWQPLHHGVDSLGVAIDRDQNIYFGLGAADYTKAYLVDGAGKAHYDLKSERGTILKVASDFSHHEIVCTGIRFSVALAVNRNGDLFATDQEGATWLPNGNPLDKLLCIEPNRHYGFPPKHPSYLPNVIDEPSVFDYGPQHQSTCGLVFDEPVNNGPVFGPAAWESDAIITGYSRGKLFRTRLVKTPAGYVAQSQIVAHLNMLTVDACVSPQGELVVACHSGPPDWGSGPTGKGKLYKISYRGRDEPQPVACWGAGPHEARIAFDRPLDPEWLKQLAGKVAIEYGRYVVAGERFESLRPGYAAVEQQQATPRFDLPVYSAQVTPDRRTLILTTGQQAEAATYGLTLPSFTAPTPLRDELAQSPAIDLAYDMTGVSATWQATGNRAKDTPATWSGWLPHLNLAVARKFTAGSADHDAFWETSRRTGRLTLRTQFDLWNMLRPDVQPGSHLDYTPPPEQVVVELRSAVPLEVKFPATQPEAIAEHDGGRRVTIRFTPKSRQLIPIEIRLTTDGQPPELDATWSTADDPRPRAFPLRRMFVPWARLEPAGAEMASREIPELKGGNWLRGREVFFGQQAGCAKCHRVRNEGGQIGPDLSNLVHRDYASVLRDIVEPSAAINPDYIPYSATLKDGRVLTGVFRSDSGGRVVFGDTTGKETIVERSAIDELRPLKLSIMPAGLEKAVGSEKLRDLLTFLLTEPLDPAPLEHDGAPPPRRRAEVDAVRKGADVMARSTKRLHILLAAGPKDHGPGEHDYPLWQRRWKKLLAVADNVEIDVADGWPSPDQWRKNDVVVFYSDNPGWTEQKAPELDAFLNRGGGLVYIHYAVDGHNSAEALAARIGLAWRGNHSKFRHGPLELTFPDAAHPITRGFTRLALFDESYWDLIGDPARIHLLAGGTEEGKMQPLVWTREQGHGRVMVSIPGHFTWTFDDPLFRILLLRGICWTAHEPVDRLSRLATLGARIAE